jgi:hypothetical protein
MKVKFLGLLAVALLTGPLAAQAAPITYYYTYAFTVNGGPSGPLARQTSTGSFTFPSSDIPAGGGSVSGFGLFTGLSFTWDSISYTARTANTMQMIFSSSGALLYAAFGSDCFSGCSVSVNSTDWFDSVGVIPSFIYALPSYSTVFYGSTGPATLVATKVPEPSTRALFGIGMGALLFLVRRRRMA